MTQQTIDRMMDNWKRKKLIKRLNTFEKSRWLEFGEIFNSWEFPMEFYDLLPSWWGNSKKMSKKFDGRTRGFQLIWPVMEIIKAEFGEREALRYHNVNKGCMTNPEFDYWYKSKNDDIESEWFDKYYTRRSKVETLEWWKDDVFEELEPIIQKYESENNR